MLSNTLSVGILDFSLLFLSLSFSPNPAGLEGARSGEAGRPACGGDSGRAAVRVLAA